MKNILRWITAGLTATFVALAAHAADMAPGTFAAGTVNGDVSYKLAGTSTYLKLEAGTTLPQGSTIKTAPGALAIVVFSSGSTATVRPDSEVVINFDQKPFTGPIPAGAEPSVSKTQIKIVNGTVISKVAKLKKGSEFNVTSPVGAAGVRGTTFEVTYNSATGVFVVLVAEGAVAFTKGSDGTVTPVNAGQVTTPSGEVKQADPAAIAAITAALSQVDVPSPTAVDAGTAEAPTESAPSSSQSAADSASQGGAAGAGPTINVEVALPDTSVVSDN
jgi:hypothetical protein